MQQGFLEEITEFRDRHRDDCFYIPSFIITREDRSTTKHRLVFNAAQAFSGKSLNDYLSPGPNNMCDLTQVLLRFRRHPFTYTCDIKQMYMQIKVHPKDRPYLRFFHRDSHSQQIIVYQSSGHLFGLNCSPFVAIETLKHHTRCQAKTSLAWDAILNNSIVDDVLVSLPRQLYVSQLHQELGELLSLVSMQLHKVASNDSSFVRDVPVHLRVASVNIDDKPLTPTIKTLGLIYESKKRLFQV